MRDSLHLRSNVTVRGQKGKTILRKADGAVSPLVLDGDSAKSRSLERPQRVCRRMRRGRLGR